MVRVNAIILDEEYIRELDELMHSEEWDELVEFIGNVDRGYEQFNG